MVNICKYDKSRVLCEQVSEQWHIIKVQQAIKSKLCNSVFTHISPKTAVSGSLNELLSFMKKNS